jgi:hypothetical protein
VKKIKLVRIEQLCDYIVGIVLLVSNEGLLSKWSYSSDSATRKSVCVTAGM